MHEFVSVNAHLDPRMPIPLESAPHITMHLDATRCSRKYSHKNIFRCLLIHFVSSHYVRRLLDERFCLHDSISIQNIC